MSRPIFLSADWRHLCLLNYEIDPSILLPHLPYGVELDFLNEKTYVSLVAFMFYKTKAFGMIPAFFHRDFEEINLRFYVTRKEGSEIKRGVVFIKEIVPSPLLAFVARHFYYENYVAMPTSHQIQQGKTYEYQFGDNRLLVESNTKLMKVPPESPERWITEHYWGYAKINESKTYEYEVKHPVWNLYEVTHYKLDANIGKLYGQEFASTFSRPPSSVFLADGSDITVHYPLVIK